MQQCPWVTSLVSMGTCPFVLIEMSAGLSTERSQPIERDPVKRSCSSVSFNGPVKELKRTFIHWHLTASHLTSSSFHLMCLRNERYRKTTSETLLEFIHLGKCLRIKSQKGKRQEVTGFLFQSLTYWILKSSRVEKQTRCWRRNGHHL